MMRPVRFLCAAGAVLGLAACSSAPIHFYTLVPPTSTSTNRVLKAVPYRISVLPVTVPAQVDRPQIVVREGRGSVALLENRQWIAPLADEIRTVVSADLTRRLGVQDVYSLTSANGKPVYRIKLDITRFESVPAQYTLLAATWSVQSTSGNKPILQCSSSIREQVGKGYDALVLGHQQGINALAGKMAMAVQRLALSGDAHCPL